MKFMHSQTIYMAGLIFFGATSRLNVGLVNAQTLPVSAATQSHPASPPPLALSPNHHYLIEAPTGKPFFLLADTAWNMNALTDEEIDTYVHDRHSHGFNTIMFCLDFFPQAASENAYGQRAYIGPDKSELNPEYFAHCDRAIATCAAEGMYAMIYSMWGGPKAGTMNTYTPDHLHALGIKLGEHYKGQSNVILVAGGESSPPNVDVERANAMGSGLKEGCEGKNLITIHPCSNRSSSQGLSKSPWLDFYMSQIKSGRGGEKVEMTKYVADDFLLADPKPTMVVEHRYEVGTQEPPIIQRRSLYLSVFAGGCGYAYGHNALWQMSPTLRKNGCSAVGRRASRSGPRPLTPPPSRNSPTSKISSIRALILNGFRIKACCCPGRGRISPSVPRPRATEHSEKMMPLILWFIHRERSPSRSTPP